MKTGTFTCLDCWAEFEEPITWTETHGLDPPYEKWDGCPVCGGPFTKTLLCDHCMRRITGDYVRTASGAVYCESCFEEHQLGDE